MSTLGGVFSFISGMHERICMKLLVITHYQVHVTHFQGQEFKEQDHRQHFSKTHFFGEGSSRRPSSFFVILFDKSYKQKHCKTHCSTLQ